MNAIEGGATPLHGAPCAPRRILSGKVERKS